MLRRIVRRGMPSLIVFATLLLGLRVEAGPAGSPVKRVEACVEKASVPTIASEVWLRHPPSDGTRTVRGREGIANYRDRPLSDPFLIPLASAR